MIKTSGWLNIYVILIKVSLRESIRNIKMFESELTSGSNGKRLTLLFPTLGSLTSYAGRDDLSCA